MYNFPILLVLSDLAIRKVLFNPNKVKLSVMNLRSPGPVAEQTITVKVKCLDPFSNSLRGSLVLFKTKWRQYKYNFHVSFRVIVAMLQHRPFQNIKTDGNEFKVFYEKECNILCALVCLSDLQLSREIFSISESQCELISNYCEEIKISLLNLVFEKIWTKISKCA